MASSGESVDNVEQTNAATNVKAKLEEGIAGGDPMDKAEMGDTGECVTYINTYATSRSDN